MYITGCFKPNVLTLLFWSKGYFWIFGLCVYEYKNLMQIISTLMNLSKAFYGPTFINQLNVSINYTKDNTISKFFYFRFHSAEVIVIRINVIVNTFLQQRLDSSIFFIDDYNDSFPSLMNFLFLGPNFQEVQFSNVKLCRYKCWQDNLILSINC